MRLREWKAGDAIRLKDEFEKALDLCRPEQIQREREQLSMALNRDRWATWNPEKEAWAVLYRP